VSPKAEKFLEALKALCREHSVYIATSGYDGLDICDLDPSITDEQLVWFNGIEDRTAGGDKDA
jgi:hypothetical protein